ncbi:MAG: hypothetical protein KGQ59_12010 [Bdellovibrionales bacterium]|nr:hypothetical protein [Bdellovibrionales bacterium]
MKRIQNALVLISGLLIFGCANPYKVKELDESKLDKKGEIQGATIGINENREVVIEQKTEADAELRKLAASAYDLEVKLAHSNDDLERCREELSDPRLGGSGKVIDIPEIDNLKPASQIQEEFGVTKDGKLRFVRTEKFLDRLTGQRKYNDTLREQLKLTEKHQKSCLRDMRAARVKAGLPGERYTGQGQYVNGAYVQTRRAEKSLDDAFAIASEEKAKVKQEKPTE